MKKYVFTDDILLALVKKYPPPAYKDKSEQLFERLVDAVISQQLSVKAADTIYKRFLELFHDKTFPTPKDVLKMQDEHIR
ncbi:MAG: DNA-3-methyladenine glycosylase 2 family protein, partial [Candidatus Levyibacteriota bacterium]